MLKLFHHGAMAWIILLLQLAVLTLLWSPLKRAWCRRCPAHASVSEKKMMRPRKIRQPTRYKLGQLALYLQLKKERARQTRIKALAAYTALRKKQMKPLLKSD